MIASIYVVIEVADRDVTDRIPVVRKALLANPLVH
jgi:hypothetical protein